jgi:hypothetical protein
MAPIAPAVIIDSTLRSDATPGRGVLPYVAGSRRRRRNRGLLLTATAVGQGLYGAALVCLSGLMIEKVSLRLALIELLATAFVLFGGLAGILHIAAAVALLGRRRSAPGVPYLKPQRLAMASLAPLLLIGVTLTTDGVWGIYHSNDPFIGYAVLFGLIVTVPAAIFFAAALAATRLL